jgi:hypothetical protein
MGPPNDEPLSAVALAEAPWGLPCLIAASGIVVGPPSTYESPVSVKTGNLMLILSLTAPVKVFGRRE